MPDRVGQQLGNYRLIRSLGHGGFADVYLGEHVHLGTQAAIKVLDTRLSQEEVEHFRDEARTIARLEHPHIVRVLDFGVEEHIPFLVMSYATQGSLRQRYPKGTRLPLATIVAYVKQIAAALQYAHNEKLIHRDIKPENMLMGRNHEVLLSDFGLAVVAQSSVRSGMRDVSGTIVYMAPEQARGRPQPASDQYALGIVVYEWLCGVRPFTGTFEEVAIQHAMAQPAALQEHLPTISAAIQAIVMRTLEKSPAQRFGSVQDFAGMLEQAYLVEIGRPAAVSTPSIPSIPSSIGSPTAPLSSVAPEGACSTERNATEMIYTVAWSPDRRRIAYGGRDKTIQVRGATTGASTLLYHEHNGSVTTIAWSPDGQKIASASLDKTIQVWNSTTGKKITSYDSHTGMVSAIAWSPDGLLIAATGNNTDTAVHIWDALSGRDRFTYRGHAHWVRAMAWSPNGRYLASGSKNEVQIWESTTGKKLFVHKSHNSWVRAIAWSPDGTRIATAGEDHTVQVWEPTNKGHLLAVHRGHADWIHTVIWSPDGNWLASASKDNVVHVWKVESANHASIYPVRSPSIYAITWLADSKHIVSANSSGAVQLWQIE